MKWGNFITLRVLIFLCFAAYHPDGHAQSNDSLKTVSDTAAVSGDIVADQSEPPLPKYYREDDQSMNGMIIPDDEDSTILMLTWGNYRWHTDGYYYANGGPMLYNDKDSVIITTDRVYEDDSTRVIYTRGQRSYTTCCHDMYTEDEVILHKVDSGWLVSDSREEEFLPDFRTLTCLGTYGGQFYLMRLETAALYGGGHIEDYQDYFFISRDHFMGPSISLSVAHSDEMAGNCDSAHVGWNQSPDCGCYSDRGSTTYGYDSILDCIVIGYNEENVEYQCMQTNPKTTRTRQVWYMNGKSMVLAVDIDSIAKGEDTSGYVKLKWKKSEKKAINLTRRQIEKALGETDRRKKYGFIKSPTAGQSIFNER